MKSKLLLISILTLAILVSGCSISVKSKGGGGNDGGVFISPNKGEIFRQMTAMPTISGRAQNVGYLNVNNLAADPNDAAAMYLASYDYGLFYTYNVTEGWNYVEGLGQNTINDVVVDPGVKCTIYAAIGNQIMRSIDCSRSWQQIYFGPNTESAINSVAVDHYFTDHIYVGNSNGDLVKSVDNGKSWRTIYRFNSGVEDIFVNPKDSRDVFVATEDNQLYRVSLDGSQWTNLREEMPNIDLGSSFVDLLFSETDGTVIWATDKLLLRSPDNGLSWSQIRLLTSPDESHIRAADLNSANPQEMYYATNTVFASSLDGGLTWTIKDLPTQRAASDIVIDTENTNLIYLSVTRQQ